MIVMSGIAYDWIALGVAAILFVILAFLKRKKNAGFTHTRVACNGIRYHFGNRFQRPH